jgi:hypothetical protein
MGLSEAKGSQFSSETLLEKIAGFTPDDIYNLPPVPEEIGDDKEMEEV